MRLIAWLVWLSSVCAFAENDPSSELINQQSDKIAEILENPKSFEMGKKLDETLSKIVERAAKAFKSLGDDESAHRIQLEYDLKFANFNQSINSKELGDYDYLSEWLLKWHNKIHEKLGDNLCKFLHTHDMEIINFGVPVVRSPELYDLKEYQDHFGGHMVSPLRFAHNGVAGVVVYWSVNAVCSVGTSGMGDVVFACGPIAAVAEFGFDKHISPKLVLKIWTKHQ